MPPRPSRFGDVWTIKGGVMGPEPWLIVSNNLYLKLSEDNMLAVPIRDTSRPGSRVVTEAIPDVGQAVLDRITALPRTWLIGDEPVVQLHPDRHAEVGRRICNLIGPLNSHGVRGDRHRQRGLARSRLEVNRTSNANAAPRLYVERRCHELHRRGSTLIACGAH